MEFYFAVLAQYKAPTVYARDSLLLYGTSPSRKAWDKEQQFLKKKSFWGGAKVTLAKWFWSLALYTQEKYLNFLVTLDRVKVMEDTGEQYYEVLGQE